VGEYQLPREMSVLITEPAQEDARGGLAQKKEAIANLEDKQDRGNEEKQQDSVRDLNPDMEVSNGKDPAGEALQQILLPRDDQSRATVSESESPMLAFQDLSSPAYPSFPWDDLLVYSRRR
jgi:hypothetical protein